MMSKTLLLFLTLALAPVPHLLAGDIVGTVRAHAKEGAEQAAAGGKYDSRKFKFVEKVDYSRFRDFVVYIDQPVAVKTNAPPKTVEVITQKDATFRPHVMPIVAGTTVSWPNNDDIYHNVFSYSETRPFDLGLYKSDKGDVPKVPFPTPGRVDAFCSIHSQMHCIILVLENPFFATTDAKGGFVITNVPAGTYRLKAWHERLPAEAKEVIVPEKGSVRMEFDLTVKGLPKF